jgi:hypothetical protein
MQRVVLASDFGPGWIAPGRGFIIISVATANALRALRPKDWGFSFHLVIVIESQRIRGLMAPQALVTSGRACAFEHQVGPGQKRKLAGAFHSII